MFMCFVINLFNKDFTVRKEIYDSINPIPEEAKPLLDELEKNGADLLDDIQFQLLYARLKGLSYDLIKEILGIKHNKQIGKIITRTVEGRKNIQTPGKKSFLGDIDKELFTKTVKECCHDINCLNVYEASELAIDIHHRRMKSATALLILMGNEGLVEKVTKEKELPEKWVKKHCKSLGLIVCRPQELELARRIHCNIEVIQDFFNKYGYLFNRHPKLIFNMDEASLNGDKQFKVIRDALSLPLTEEMGKLPHLSACITIGAGGHTLKPMIILPNLQTLKSLEAFTNEVLFTTSLTGWMNEELFVAFALHFITEISKYRTTLPDDLKNEEILLVVDGHPSRYSPEAVMLLKQNNIKLLILPPHCSHCLQPFDVGIASPLKTAFKKMISKAFKDARQGEDGERIKLTADLQRYILIIAFLDALQVSTTRSNIKAAFKKSGLFPMNASEPLNSHWAMTITTGKFAEVRSREGKATELTSDEELDDLITKKAHMSVERFGQELDGILIVKRLTKNRKSKGRLISKLGPIYQMFRGQITINCKDGTEAVVDQVILTLTNLQ